MMPETILDHFKVSDAVLDAAIQRAIEQYGIPISNELAEVFTEALFFDVLEMRRYLHARQIDILTATKSQIIAAPRPRFYSINSLNKVVRESAGLSQRPALALIEAYDAATQRMETKRVAPWTEPHDPEIINEYGRRLSANAGQHTKSAARDAVTESARLSGVPWARRLTGRENCAWCALQASRGAVFSEETVLFETHPNCDCYAVVAEGDWSGKEEADELDQLWRDSGGMSGFRKHFQKEKEPTI